MTETRRQTVLLTLTGGGFLYEALALSHSLAGDFDLAFVTTDDSSYMFRDGGKNIPPGDVHTVSKLTTIGDSAFLRRAKNALVCFLDSYKVIRRVKPDAVVCVGSSIAVPLCFWARAFRVKSVFVESITRVTSPSTTGRIVSALRLCDRLYVQWPEAVDLYRAAVYKGMVL